MELYLIRHGIAADSEGYTNDQERPLTEIGLKKTRKVAKQLCERGLRFPLILTSPLVRAKETALILRDAGLGSQVEEFADLAPEGDIQTWVSWFEQHWQKSNGEGSLALVGHQPDLGKWAETLVWGQAQEKIILKKAGVIGLNIPHNGELVGRGELFLLISPKWLIF